MLLSNANIASDALSRWRGMKLERKMKSFRPLGRRSRAFGTMGRLIKKCIQKSENLTEYIVRLPQLDIGMW